MWTVFREGINNDYKNRNCITVLSSLLVLLFSLHRHGQEKSILSILLGNRLLFTVVFSALWLVLKNPLGLNNFGTTFLFFLALGEGLGVFDFVIIDLLWWRNTKRIRFSFLPEKADYQNPSKHIGSFLRGVPLFAVVALLSAVIVIVDG